MLTIASLIQKLQRRCKGFLINDPCACLRLRKARQRPGCRKKNSINVNELVGQEIAAGHAFEKHVLQQGEFAGLGIRTREQFARLIESIINSPTATRQLSGGRVAYWGESTSTVVIRNARAVDGGTAFQPANGRAYFEALR